MDCLTMIWAPAQRNHQGNDQRSLKTEIVPKPIHTPSPWVQELLVLLLVLVVLLLLLLLLLVCSRAWAQ